MSPIGDDYLKEKYSINFHQTFPPDLDNIGRILNIADEYGGLSKEEIFEITGIPTGKSSGKVEPAIKYAQYMNLIRYKKKGDKYTILTTEFGKVVKNEDRYLQEKVTKLLCNYYLTSSIYGAKMWNELFRKFPEYFGNEISLELLSAEIKKVLGTASEVKLTPFKNTYMSENGFQDLNLIEFNADKTNSRIIYNVDKYDRESIYGYCYTLVDELTSTDNNRLEFTVDEIFHKICWNRGYQWSEEFAFEVLEKFKNEGLITINKQLNPITIVMNIDKETLSKKIYSFLI